MPKITDALKDLGIDKDQFADLYKEVLGVDLKPKTSVVSEKNMEQIEKIVAERGLAKKKTVVKKVIKKSEVAAPGAKVIKSDQFMDKTGFLSGMGFESDEVVVVEDDEEEVVDTAVTKKDFDVIKEQVAHEKQTAAKAKPEQKKGEDFFAGVKRTPPPNRQGHSNRPNFSKGKPHQPKYKKPEERRAAPTPAAQRAPKEATTSQNLIKKAEIVIDKKISVKEFSEKMGIGLPEVMKVLLKNQIMVGINSALDFDTASLIGEELGVKVVRKEAKLKVESFLSGDLQAILDLDKDATTLEERSPIVTVMGHVDHGKTTLLDYLRKTAVAGGEAGGITQGIGASVVDHDGKKITFIDTPGHELFTSLRARGAKLTNVAVIVVAADDSVMPQTIESINHAKAAGVPIIIAVTKIDKPGIHIDQIKNDLAARGITPEDWGGDTPIIGVSGITGQGIPDLLEAILLHSEMLELKFNPNRAAVGVVLDAYKDPKQGVVASIIVMTGTLHLRDVVVAYNTSGKIRRMWDRTGKDVKTVKGGEPVQVLGFTELPEPGRIVEIVKNEKDAVAKVALIQAQEQEADESNVLQDFLNQLSGSDAVENPTLRLVLKSDGSSSLEALKQAVAGISVPENVDVKIIHSDAGYFSDSDLSLAQASKALLLGFNISLNSAMKKKAQALGVEIKSFDIIYELTEYLENLLLGMIKYEEEEVTAGKLEVLGVFFKKGKEMVIGGRVIEGLAINKAKFIVHRGEEELCKGEIESLQVDQQAVKEVKETYECGMKVKVAKKIEVGDILEFRIMQEKR